MPDRSISASLSSVPGTLFGVDGARAWSNALKLNAGSRGALNQFASLFASFDGEFSKHPPLLRRAWRGESQLVNVGRRVHK